MVVDAFTRPEVEQIAAIERGLVTALSINIILNILLMVLGLILHTEFGMTVEQLSRFTFVWYIDAGIHLTILGFILYLYYVFLKLIKARSLWLIFIGITVLWLLGKTGIIAFFIMMYQINQIYNRHLKPAGYIMGFFGPKVDREAGQWL